MKTSYLYILSGFCILLAGYFQARIESYEDCKDILQDGEDLIQELLNKE